MKRITLRLPDDLAEEITKQAETNSRSLNEEIVYGLRYYLAALDRITKGDQIYKEMVEDEDFWVWVNPRQWKYLQEALEFAKNAGFSTVDESELTEL